MKKLLLVVALSFAAPAFAAGPMVTCLSGCPGKAGMLKADTAITDTWWLGPSVGLALQAYDNSTKTWETSLAFQFQYGVKWRPSWSPMPTFMSLDLGLQAGTTNIPNATTPSYFQITLAPTITFLDIIAVGYGPRFKFSDGLKVGGVFFLGLSTSFGGP